MDHLSPHLLFIDIQEKIFEKMSGKDALQKNILTLLKACQILNISVTVSEQYPKGLGTTLTVFKDMLLAQATYFEKTTFACTQDNTLNKWIIDQGKTVVFVLVGIESHICVLLTALELRKMGFSVIVLADCVASRKIENKDIALREMIHQGICVTSLESFLFRQLKDAKHQKFKEISALFK